MSDSLAVGLATDRGAKLLRADPVRNGLFAGRLHRQFWYALTQFDETLLTAANSFGKTRLGARAAVALLRGVSDVDGRTRRDALAGIPRWPLAAPRIDVPGVGWLVSPSYKVSLDSTIAALRLYLRGHPHREVRVGGSAVESFLIEPDFMRGQGMTSDWSRLTLQVDRGEEPVGGRVGFVWADEPPSQFMWDECRQRSIGGGSPFLMYLTLTPIERRFWKWIRDQFGACTPPQGRDGRVILQGSLWENEFLTERDIRDKLAKAKNSPYELARLYGQFVDTVGGSPWDAPGLERWRSLARRGRRGNLVARDTGWTFVPAENGWLEIWAEPHPQECYVAAADTSRGIEDVRHVHDPSGILVAGRRSKRVIARVNGYHKPYELGEFLYQLSRYYRPCQLMPEVNVEGEALILGVTQSGERHGDGEIDWFVTVRYDRYRQVVSRAIGWNTSMQSRSVIMSALGRAIKEDLIDFPSPEGIESISAMVFDEDGKPVAADGDHDEDGILLGMIAHHLEQYDPGPVQVDRVDLGGIIRRELGLPRAQDLVGGLLDPMDPTRA